MKKGIRGWVLLVFAGMVFFISAVYFIIPKAAALTLPFKWNSIPLQQKRELVLQYFGRPVDSPEAYTDRWVAQRDNGAYILKIHYDKDSLADSYKLYYDYKQYFIHKQYLLEEK